MEKSSDRMGAGMLAANDETGATIDPSPMATGDSIGQQNADQNEESWIKHWSHEHKLKHAYSNVEFKCQVCKQKAKRYKYKCHECQFHIDENCGKLPDSLYFFDHKKDHKLFPKMPTSFGCFSKCNFCGKATKGMAYKCEVEGCKFSLHPHCSQALEQVVKPPSHPLHTLKLVPSDSTKCDVCTKKCKHYSYHCEECQDVHIHVECLDRGSTNDDDAAALDHGGDKVKRMCASCIKCLTPTCKVAHCVFCFVFC